MNFLIVEELLKKEKISDNIERRKMRLIKFLKFSACCEWHKLLKNTFSRFAIVHLSWLNMRSCGNISYRLIVCHLGVV